MSYGHSGWRKIWIEGDDPGVFWVPVNPMLEPGEVEIFLDRPRTEREIMLDVEWERIASAAIDDLDGPAVIIDLPREDS